MKPMILDMFNFSVMGNSLLQIAISVCVIISGVIIIVIIKNHIKRIRNKSAENDKLSRPSRLFNMQKYAIPLAYILLVYFSLTGFLTLAEQPKKVIYVTFIVLSTLSGIRLLTHLVGIRYMLISGKEMVKKAKNRSIAAFVELLHLLT